MSDDRDDAIERMQAALEAARIKHGDKRHFETYPQVALCRTRGAFFTTDKAKVDCKTCLKMLQRREAIGN